MVTKRVLLAEDNEDNRELFIQIFNILGEGIELFTVDKGKKALSFLENEDADLILLDIHMPDMNGIDVMQQIRKCNKFCSVPIVALSASALQSEINAAMQSGFDEYITKPIHVSTFMDRVYSFMQ